MEAPKCIAPFWPLQFEQGHRASQAQGMAQNPSVLPLSAMLQQLRLGLATKPSRVKCLTISHWISVGFGHLDPLKLLWKSQPGAACPLWTLVAACWGFKSIGSLKKSKFKSRGWGVVFSLDGERWHSTSEPMDDCIAGPLAVASNALNGCNSLLCRRPTKGLWPT